MTDRLPGQIDPPQAHAAARQHQEQRQGRPPTEHTLLGTADPLVWAQEFCRIFNGKMIAADEFSDAQSGPVNPGTMVGWFANAMQTALTLFNRELEPVDEDVDEPVDESVEQALTLEEQFLEGFNEGRKPEEM